MTNTIEVEVSSLAWAVQMLSEGKKVKRESWGKGGYLHINDGWLVTEEGYYFEIVDSDFKAKWELAE